MLYLCKMNITTNNLTSVSDYAKAHSKSLAWAYKQISSKKVKTEKIGSMTFIIKEIKKK